MNYSETIDYLFSRLPLFSRIGPAAYKADLTNTIELCRLINDPQRNLKTIHIAGTNGKGSVSHMFASILQQAGFKTGLYTSPHLKDFRERIKINGHMITEDFVISFTEKIKPAIEKIEPSFFEITVAMAFDYFANEKVDIAVIETGLGGRLDSTNIIIPEISVITNIGMDHTNLLGDSIEKITVEKAGIIKQGKPVIIGEVIPETKPIFEETAAKQNSRLIIASERRKVMNWEWSAIDFQVEVAQQNKTDHQVYHLDLQGIYQAKNLLTVLAGIDELKNAGWKIDEKDIHEGLRTTKKSTGFHGRWEKISIHPSVIIDVAHNEDGIRQLLRQIELTDYNELRLIIGMVKDKDVKKILSMLPAMATYYFTQANIPRALDADILTELGSQAGLRGKAFKNVNDALRIAKSDSHENDLIVVCGSVFIVGEIW